MRATALAVLVLVATTLPACEQLTVSEKDKLDEITYYGLEVEQHYDRGTAMGLNFLFGIGNFYLDQTGYGVMNLLLWPLSILWAPAQAWADAPILNQKYTVDYYRTRAGEQRLAEAKAAGEDEGP